MGRPCKFGAAAFNKRIPVDFILNQGYFVYQLGYKWPQYLSAQAVTESMTRLQVEHTNHLGTKQWWYC